MYAHINDALHMVGMQMHNWLYFYMITVANVSDVKVSLTQW